MISFKKHCSSLIFLSFFTLNLVVATLPANAAKKHGSHARIAQLEFRDISVSDALKVLSQQSNLNIVASQEAAKIRVTMYFQDVAPLNVIDALSKTYNLWYKYDEQTHIIRIYTVKEYRMEQVEFKQEETQIFTLKNAKNALDLADTVSNLYGSRVRLSFGQNQQELMNDLRQRFQRFDLIDGRTRLNTASSSSNSGNSGSRNNSGSSGNSNSNGNNNSSGNNSNTGNNNSNGNNANNSNQRQNSNQPNSVDAGLDNLSQSLKKNTAQEGLLAGESEAMDSAVTHQSPIYVSVIKHQNRVLVRTRDNEAMADIKKLYHKLNNESSMMLMEVKILSLNLGDDFNSLFDFKLKSATTNVTSGQQANLATAVTNTLAAAANTFNPALLATVVSQNFEARLQLLEKENRVTELATPMLMTTNQEVSRVFIGEERPITTGYSGSSSNTAAAGTTTSVIVNAVVLPTTEVRNLGTTLLLTPNINADRTVSINILIEQSGLSPQQGTIPIPSANGLEYANVDVVQSKTFSGTVVAKNDAAIAVGGLISENASNRENKVPILGDIPGLGFFFRDEAQARGRQELVVIIKPHIIATPSEASEATQQFMQKNSVHPNADDAGSLDVYTNPTGEHKDYRLEKPFKEYPAQDVFDKYRDRGGAQKQ